jgi:tRNA 2-selenouridine synthase
VTLSPSPHRRGHATPETFDRLLLEGRPLLDVRAPVEFRRGAIPGAVNLPLLTDEERHQVGLRYKQAGQDAAIRLGETLVSGPARTQRIEAWLAWAHRHPEGLLYCFRGGQRSRIAQAWLADAGCDLPRIPGGYKALRQHLMARLEALAPSLPLRVLGGRTGTGKTRILQTLSRAVDLEGLANHRGSAFGPRVTPQPTPIDFEHALAVDLMRLAENGLERPVAIEDESRNVGRLSLPTALHESLSRAPLALLERPIEARVEITLQEYVIDGLAEHQAACGAAAAFEAFSTYLTSSLDKVRRRLGGARHAQLRGLMEDALRRQRESGDLERHRIWIQAMLEDYYDPMYDHQLAQKRERVVFSGPPDAVQAWLEDQTLGAPQRD